jgi:hypothetical protein
MIKPTIRAIELADIPAVARLLHRRFMADVPVATIERVIRHDWPVERPNYGYLMEANGTPVGCILAAYSEREVRGRREFFCNVGTWYVEPAYRAFSLALSTKLLKQERPCTFTALTPNPTSQSVFPRFNYQVLSPGFDVYLPGARWARGWRTGVRLVNDVEQIARELEPPQRRILEDHRPYAVRHFLLQRRGSARHAYIVTRRRKFHRLGGRVPVTELMYVSDKELAVRHFEWLMLGILAHDRSLALAADRRLLGADAPTGMHVPRPRFFRSPTLGADDIDNLYSEVVLL